MQREENDADLQRSSVANSNRAQQTRNTLNIPGTSTCTPLRNEEEEEIRGLESKKEELAEETFSIDSSSENQKNLRGDDQAFTAPSPSIIPSTISKAAHVYPSTCTHVYPSTCTHCILHALNFVIVCLSVSCSFFNFAVLIISFQICSPKVALFRGMYFFLWLQIFFAIFGYLLTGITPLNSLFVGLPKAKRSKLICGLLLLGPFVPLIFWLYLTFKVNPPPDVQILQNWCIQFPTSTSVLNEELHGRRSIPQEDEEGDPNDKKKSKSKRREKSFEDEMHNIGMFLHGRQWLLKRTVTSNFQAQFDCTPQVIFQTIFFGLVAANYFSGGSSGSGGDGIVISRLQINIFMSAIILNIFQISLHLWIATCIGYRIIPICAKLLAPLFDASALIYTLFVVGDLTLHDTHSIVFWFSLIWAVKFCFINLLLVLIAACVKGGRKGFWQALLFVVPRLELLKLSHFLAYLTFIGEAFPDYDSAMALAYLFVHQPNKKRKAATNRAMDTNRMMGGKDEEGDYKEDHVGLLAGNLRDSEVGEDDNTNAGNQKQEAEAEQEKCSRMRFLAVQVLQHAKQGNKEHRDLVLLERKNKSQEDEKRKKKEKVSSLRQSDDGGTPSFQPGHSAVPSTIAPKSAVTKVEETEDEEAIPDLYPADSMQCVEAICKEFSSNKHFPVKNLFYFGGEWKGTWRQTMRDSVFVKHRKTPALAAKVSEIQKLTDSIDWVLISCRVFSAIFPFLHAILASIPSFSAAHRQEINSAKQKLDSGVILPWICLAICSLSMLILVVLAPQIYRYFWFSMETRVFWRILSGKENPKQVIDLVAQWIVLYHLPSHLHMLVASIPNHLIPYDVSGLISEFLLPGEINLKNYSIQQCRDWKRHLGLLEEEEEDAEFGKEKRV